MKPSILTGCLLGCSSAAALAGPYAPAAGQPGSTAILRTDPRFTAWANRVTSYQPGTSLGDAWKNPAKVLGPATDDPTHITGLGSGGSITLAFPCYIKDGPGADFAVFENSFSDTFIEHAWVEVSRDGVNFVRFPNFSLTANPVSGFGSIDPTDVQGLAGKYRQPYAEPFDLADVGLDHISHVRLLDVVGDGTARDSANRVIYDPYPVTGSAGFDLDAIGVIHQQTWQTLTVGALNAEGVNATALAHLPDGRFLLGAQGVLSVQNTWGAALRTVIGNGGVEFDPAFIAARNNTSSLLGAGGGFGGSSGLHGFAPDIPAQPLTASPLATLQNFSGVWWQSPTLLMGGWLVAGTNGPTGKNNITFISPDGTRSGPVTAELSTYSSGIATDASGNLFVSLYELSGPEAEVVLCFNASQVESAVTAILNQTTAPIPKTDGTRVFQFDSASSLAVDAAGRLWGSGFKTNGLQVFDPSTGASRRFTPDHATLPAGTDPLYQVQTFTRNGEGYVAFLVQDNGGLSGSPILHGLAPLSHLPVTESLASWQAFQFSATNLTPQNEATLWGPAADPDGDGLPNLVEYAQGSLPLISGSPSWTPDRNAGRLTLTFPRHPLRTDVTYIVEAANDLSGPWTAIAKSTAGQPVSGVAPANPAIEETAGNGLYSVTVRDVVATTTATRRFLRLRFSLQP